MSIVAVALGLRVARITSGLPDFLEEAIPLRLALGMVDPATGALDLNPHSFNYPSLVIYLHLAVQQCLFHAGQLFGLYPHYADYRLSFDLDPTPMVVAARAVGILADLFTVVAAMRIARRFGDSAAFLAGMLVALSPILIVTSSSIFTDSVMTACAIAAIERLLAWNDSSGDHRLIDSAALAGLAASAKYPAGALLLPILALAAFRGGRDAARRTVISAGAALAAFALTSPFVFLDLPSFWRDFRFEGAHASAGHLGSVAHASFSFHAANLATNLGWVGAALAAASPLALRDPSRRVAGLVLGACILLMGLPIALAHIDANRYLAPVIVMGALLAAATFSAIRQTLPRAGSGWLAILLALAALAQPLAAGGRIVWASSDTTQIEARRWCERFLPDKAVLLQEGYAARLPSELMFSNMQASALFRSASNGVRQRMLSIRTFRVVAIPLAVSGPCTNPVESPQGERRDLPVFAHAEDFNQTFYRGGIFASADFVMTSGAIRGRFEADPVRFPVQCALYRGLDAAAPVVARFRAHDRVSGPEIVVYRVDPSTRAALEQRDSLTSFWWAEAIPRSYRWRAEQLLGFSTDSTTDPGCVTGGAAAPWVRSLAPFYGGRIAGFAQQLSTSLAAAGRWAPAARLSLGTLAALPQDVDACVIYSLCAGKLGQWRDARIAIEQTLRALGDRATDPLLRLQYARSLGHTGEIDSAREQVRAVLASVGGDNPVGAQAAALLESLKSPAHTTRRGSAD